MASDALFMALANAESQPSKALRAVQSAGEAGEGILGGYLQGRQMKAGAQEAALKPYEIWSKISDSAGPDVANSIFKQRGIPIPDMGTGGGQLNNPSDLVNQGAFGAKRLEAMKTAQGLSESGPRDPTSVRSNLLQSGMNPQAADAWLSVNTDATGKVQNKNYEDLIKGLTAKNQGLRMEGMADYFHTKSGVMSLQQNPSEMGVNTLPGAAAQVLIGSKMGKSLIAKPGSPQRTAAARADAARTILRKSPTDEALQTMDYTGNLSQRWAVLKQNLLTDPESVDNPKIRKDMYDLFDDMQKAAMPFIANQLANKESAGIPVPPELKQRELGLNIPEIPFDAGSVQNPNISTGIPHKDPMGLFQ